MIRALSRNSFARRRNAFRDLQKRQFCNANDLPTSADVVIIGGGNVGCNTLYQLSKRGLKAVLLEKNKITSGTTWHTAGLIWRQRPNDVETTLLENTTKIILGLEKETGLDPGWINNGGIFIAHNKERLDEYKRFSTLAHLYGLESYIIGPEETVKLFPLLNSNAFYGSLYSPADGVVDPTMLCGALMKASAKYGGKLFENCSVTNIITEPTSNTRKIVAVETPFGTIQTKTVVNSCGVWSRNIAKMAGVEIPLVPMKHAYVVTDRMDGVKGVPNIRDHDASVYFRIQGESICMGGYEKNPEMLDEVAEDFHFGLYDLNYDVFGEHIKQATLLCPAFGETGIKSTVCGPESFTPDHKPLVGEDPRLTGLFHACGFNSGGMQLGGACAEQLAIWITTGRPDLHMYSYDIRRFTPIMRTDKEWIRQQSHENYTRTYSIEWPHDAHLGGRNLIKDVFHDDMVAEGAVMEQQQGWERPGYFLKEGIAPVQPYDWYGAYGHEINPDSRYVDELESNYTFEFPRRHDLIGEEAMACRTRAALFNMSYFSKFYLTGPEAQEAVDWLFTANMHKEPERVIYTCALNSKGGVEADLTVTALSQGVGTLVGPILKGRGYYIVAGGATGYQTYSHMKKEIERKGFKSILTDVTQNMGVLSIQGPKSGEILQGMTEHPITDEEIPPFMSRLITINGHVCRAMRVSFVGELGYELHIPIAHCQSIYEKVKQIGKGFDLRNAGFRALYSLSAEKGYHLWGHDLRLDDNPIEAGLGMVCRKTGEYAGMQHVDTLRKEGIKKQRVIFTMNDKIPVYGYETIWRDDQIVGFLRRGEYAYALDSSLGIGYVTHPKGEPVTKSYLISGKYDIEVKGIRYPATMHLKSPFDPKNQRTLGIYEQQAAELTNFED